MKESWRKNVIRAFTYSLAYTATPETSEIVKKITINYYSHHSMLRIQKHKRDASLVLFLAVIYLKKYCQVETFQKFNIACISRVRRRKLTYASEVRF